MRNVYIKAHHLVSLGAGGTSVSGSLVFFWQNDVFRFSVRRWILGSSRLRERFLHSGAIKVLPNEENAPALCLQETYLG